MNRDRQASNPREGKSLYARPPLASRPLGEFFFQQRAKLPSGVYRLKTSAAPPTALHVYVLPSVFLAYTHEYFPGNCEVLRKSQARSRCHRLQIVRKMSAFVCLSTSPEATDGNRDRVHGRRHRLSVPVTLYGHKHSA